MHHGSCACGTIRYQIEAELGAIVHCHCGQCRKAQGTAFATNAPVSAKSFRIVAGAEALTEYESSPGKRRCFCSRCGSPIISKRDGHPQVRVRLGTLDSPVTATPTLHTYAASKAEWDLIHDDLPQHAEL
jgi:hypothetical protein